MLPGCAAELAPKRSQQRALARPGVAGQGNHGDWLEEVGLYPRQGALERRRGPMDRGRAVRPGLAIAKKEVGFFRELRLEEGHDQARAGVEDTPLEDIPVGELVDPGRSREHVRGAEPTLEPLTLEPNACMKTGRAPHDVVPEPEDGDPRGGARSGDAKASSGRYEHEDRAVEVHDLAPNGERHRGQLDRDDERWESHDDHRSRVRREATDVEMHAGRSRR